MSVQVCTTTVPLARKNNAEFYTEEYEVVEMQSQTVSSPAHGPEVWSVPVKRTVSSITMRFQGNIYHLGWQWSKLNRPKTLAAVEAYFAVKSDYELRRAIFWAWDFHRKDG